ncbi:MAG: hypothetical protein DMG30_28925 [Acidobacteria bacterium]|nr:MAG: hypothetical protein DMG30_28925 [Acidobacteriota bacterium]
MKGGVSAARQTGAAEISTVDAQNGQSEPYYHRKGASAFCVLREGAGGLGFRAKEKLKTEIPADSNDARRKYNKSGVAFKGPQIGQRWGI